MAYPDVMMPDSWYPHDMQSKLFAASIKMPVNNNENLSKILGYTLPSKSKFVYLPSFGDFSLNHIYEATGGNPISQFDRSKLCIAITPTIEKFSYSKTVHGIPTHVREVVDDVSGLDEDLLNEVLYIEPGYFPNEFVPSSRDAVSTTIESVKKYTDQNFEILGSKLSPLSSGKGNIAVFLYFPNGCPFENQMFINSSYDDNTKIRIIPNPIISPCDFYNPAAKITLKFIDVDNNLYESTFAYIRNTIGSCIDTSNNLRFIKMDKKTNSIYAVVQLVNPLSSSNISALKKLFMSKSFTPYIIRDVVVEDTYIS